MVPYIFCFAIALCLLKSSEKFKSQQRLIIDMLAIILLCCFAGGRNVNIGTDTSNYFEPIYKIALVNDFDLFLKTPFRTGIGGWNITCPSEYEFLFIFVVYIVTKITGSFFWCKFIIHLLIILPLYWLLRRRKNISVCFGMFIFLMLFYNASFNLIRQSVAISFSLMSYQYLVENKIKNSIISMITAIFFHVSALLVLIVFISYLWIGNKNEKNRIKDEQKVLILILAGIVLFLGFDLLIKIISLLGLGNFAGYVSGVFNFKVNQVISRLPGAIFVIACNKQLYIKGLVTKEEALLFKVVAIYDIIFSQFAGVSAFGGRIAMYFMSYNIISYSYIVQTTRYNRIIKYFIIFYLIFYWWYYSVYLGINQTVPYIWANNL